MDAPRHHATPPTAAASASVATSAATSAATPTAATAGVLEPAFVAL